MKTKFHSTRQPLKIDKEAKEEPIYLILITLFMVLKKIDWEHNLFINRSKIGKKGTKISLRGINIGRDFTLCCEIYVMSFYIIVGNSWFLNGIILRGLLSSNNSEAVVVEKQSWF